MSLGKISLVLPIYNEVVILQQVLDKYLEDLKKHCQDFEIIAINDGCTDGSAEILADFAKNYRNFRVVNFDGRYGKQAAINAGMEISHPQSQAVILADIDILNPIGVLGLMIDHIDKGEKIVYARRENFGFDKFRAGTSDLWTRVGAKLFGLDGVYTGKANIAAYSREVVDVINALPHQNKFLRTMDTWIGWQVYYMSYASGYNKIEEKNIVKLAAKTRAELPIVRSQKITTRDRIREQTATLDYMWGFLAAALVMMIFGIIHATILGGATWTHLLTWVTFTILLLLALITYTRAVLIKRVGIIHQNSHRTLYKIQNVLN